ncbi:MAG TPA: response regulator, partial [Planctomycetota bacterium]|nr:response regulator [Planctomycetota bacterium]
PNVSEIIRHVLERDGFEVDLAQSLAEARDLLQKRPADLLTLDFILPDGNGVEFLRELRTEGKYKALPVLLISPLAPSARELAGDGLRPVEYLEKPIDLTRLSAAARGSLRKADGVKEGALL